MMLLKNTHEKATQSRAIPVQRTIMSISWSWNIVTDQDFSTRPEIQHLITNIFCMRTLLKLGLPKKKKAIKKMMKPQEYVADLNYTTIRVQLSQYQGFSLRSSQSTHNPLCGEKIILSSDNVK